jgi:nucleoid-associated protein YgaU
MAPYLPVIAVAAVVAAGAVVYAVRREPAPEAAAPPPPAAPVASAAPAPVPAPAPVAPSLDVVRVAPDGAALVAGRAEPGATVTIRTETGPLAEVEADAAGEFVAAFDAEPATEPQALTLEAESPDGTRAASPDVVVLLPAPPAPPGPSAAPEAAAPSPEAAPAMTVAPPAAAPTPPARPPQVAATALLRGSDVEVTPTAPDGSHDGSHDRPPHGLTLASISYGDAGLVTLAGLGAAGARLRAYVDDRFARDGAVGPDGRWSLELGDVEAGVYRLRIDALGPDGVVEARLETPFQRDIPSAPAPGAGRPATVTVTVQPGSNLWTLARIHYGSGALYARIYGANRELIRDPDLIYPGQIFDLPGSAPDE